MDRVETALSRFQEGFSCSQAILSTYGEEVGLARSLGLKLAAGFGGGMGRMAETCGAVTGAFMVVGLKHGRTKVGDSTARDKTDDLIREFTERFKERHGSIICRELLGCDISAPEGVELAEERDLFADLCPGLVKSAAEILEDLLR